jgi:hypothetical protein
MSAALPISTQRKESLAESSSTGVLKAGFLISKYG